MQNTIVQVDVLPLQPEQLTEPKPGKQGRAKQRCVVVAACWLTGELLCGRELAVDLLF
jgi:hypothetical protein